MGAKSKFITGLNTKTIIQKPRKRYTESEKHMIIEEMLQLGCTKQAIWEKYTGYKAEHGQILRWMRELGYCTSKSNKISNFAKKKNSMQDKSKESFEILQLKKRIEELEKQVRESEMKSIAYSTMVDIAEKEFNISIRKKFNTKPSKK